VVLGNSNALFPPRLSQPGPGPSFTSPVIRARPPTTVDPWPAISTRKAGATLADLVTVTVFLIDSRYTTRMTELRAEIFGKDFPASAALTVAGFAQPSIMIEVQGIAVRP
jgi:hypothetical protein